MTGQYEVTVGTQRVGQMDVRQIGLYYHFSCCCALSGEIIQRVLMKMEGREYNLGILVPEGGKFRLRTRIPVRIIQTGTPKFCVVPFHRKERENFVPIAPEEPFAYLTKLRQAYMVREGDRVGIAFRE